MGNIMHLISVAYKSDDILVNTPCRFMYGKDFAKSLLKLFDIILQEVVMLSSYFHVLKQCNILIKQVYRLFGKLHRSESRS